MPLLVTVVIDGLTCVFLISAVTYLARGVSYIDTNSRGARVPPSLRLAVVPFFLYSSLFIGDFTAG